MKKFFTNIFSWLQLYMSWLFLSIVCFLIYVLFFTENSIWKTFEYSNEIDKLNTEIKHTNDSIDHYRRLNVNLASDPNEMERVMRENYHMQREGEDVYIVE